MQAWDVVARLPEINTLITSASVAVAVEKDVEKVNHLLISPLVANSRFLPKYWRDRIDYNDDPSLTKAPGTDDAASQDVSNCIIKVVP